MFPRVHTHSVRNSPAINTVMISATTMSVNGTAETALSTGSSPGLTARRIFPAGTSLRTVTVIKSVTIPAVSLMALNARSQRQRASMTGTVLITMATASAIRAATRSRVAGTAWTAPLTPCLPYWTVCWLLWCDCSQRSYLGT